MPRKSLFKDRVRHDLDLVLTARGAHGIAHYSFKDDTFTLKAGSKFMGVPTQSLIDNGYSKILSSYDYLVENGILVGDVLKQDLIFKNHNLGAMGTLVSMTPIYTNGVKLANSNISFKSAITNPSLYNKYIAHCEYYDENWNVIHSEANLDIDDTDINISIEQENPSFDFETQDELKPKEVEANLPMVRDIENSRDGTDLSSFSTIEIINEILVRLLK